MFDDYNVIIVIGATNSGKSSLVKNLFLNESFQLYRDIMPYSSNGEIALIGNYFTGKRRVGTDTVERKQVGNFAQQILNLLKTHKQVVLEGMRCISRPMMSKLIDITKPLIVWVQCDALTLYYRANSASGNTGNPPTLDHIKRESTSCSNFVYDLVKSVDVVTLDSTLVKDFTEFGKDYAMYTRLNLDWRTLE